MYAVRRKTRSQQDPVGSLYCISARPLMGSPSNESLSTMFMRLSLPVVETAPASVSSKSHRHRIADTQPQHSGTSGISRSNKKSTGFTDSRHGQSVDVDMNHRATQYVGHKCEMTLFDPSALPQSLLEGIRPLVNRTNAKSSYEYEADLRQPMPSLHAMAWYSVGRCRSYTTCAGILLNHSKTKGSTSEAFAMFAGIYSSFIRKGLSW
jgi:hypothetical protein